MTITMCKQRCPVLLKGKFNSYKSSEFSDKFSLSAT